MDSETETKILSAEALVKKAKKLEEEGLEKNKIAIACASSLGQLLDEVYISQSPKQVDYDNRADLVRIFNAIAGEVFGNHGGSPIVEGFGSFVMGMFSAESDLDLSINFRDKVGEIPRLKKIQTLRKLAKKLYSFHRGGHVTGIQTIMTARVPVVKVIDHGTRIECDVSVENRDGIAKSLIIRAISTIDERFQKLSFLIKAWAKVHDINSSKEHTLNSLSLILLVAFHLQTRDPPILPPFSALFKDGNNPVAVTMTVRNYLNYGKRNSESLADLFVTLLVKLASVEILWQKGLCVSPYKGSLISKAGVPGCYMSVEDFTDQSQNVSRAVGKEGFEKIYGCIHHSLHYLEAFSDGQMQGSKLKELLFGGDAIGDSIATNLVEPTIKISVPNNPNEIKETQLTEIVGAENQSKTHLVHQEAHQTKERPCTEDLDKPKRTKRSVPSNPNGIKKMQLTETLGTENQSKTQIVHQETHRTKKRLCTEDRHKSKVTKESVPDNPIEIKKAQLTETLGAENPSKIQLAHQETHQIKKRLSTKDLDKSKGTKRGKVQVLDRRGGVQFMEGGKKQLPEKGVKPLPTTGWKGKHPVDGWREPTTFGENSGHLTTHFAPQVPHPIPFSHSLDSLICQNPFLFPSISAPNWTSFPASCNLIQLQSLVSLLNALGLNASHFLNPPALGPLPCIGPINEQHAQHQPHTEPRRPGQ